MTIDGTKNLASKPRLLLSTHCQVRRHACYERR